MLRNAKAFGWEKPVEGETNTWLTPPRLVELLGPFDLDPCEAPGQPWRLAIRGYSPPQDGLALPWLGMVWCNPPYGPHTGKWVKKMAEHGNGIMLLFARTDTRVFQSLLAAASGLFFFAGRLLFYRADGTRSTGKAAPSCLASFGSEAASRLSALPVKGALLKVVRTVGGPLIVDDLK